MDLFLDKELEKDAAFSARLTDKTENWAQELTSELFKQLPFLSDYEVNVTMDKVDEQKGYAYGSADISNKTQRPVIEHKDMGIPHVKIPIVVIEKAVKPFSVFMDGTKVLPLTEDRIRRSLFNPQSFDLSNVQPRIPSLVENLTPPYRYGIGWGGGQFKEASARFEEGLLRELGGKTKKAADSQPTPFTHMSQAQWDALQENPKVQKAVQKFGPGSKEATNAMYEIAAKIYGGFPKSAEANEAVGPHPYIYDNTVQGPKAGRYGLGAFGSENKDGKEHIWFQHIGVPGHSEPPWFRKHVPEHHLDKIGPNINEYGPVAGGEDLYASVPLEDFDEHAKTLSGQDLRDHLTFSNEVKKGIEENKRKEEQRPLREAQEKWDKRRRKYAITGGLTGSVAGAILPYTAVALASGRHNEKVDEANARMRNVGVSPEEVRRLNKKTDLLDDLNDAARLGIPLTTGGGLVGGGLLGRGLHRLIHGKRPTELPKTSSVSLLATIASTIRDRDAEDFVEKVASDSSLQAGFKRSGIAPLLVDVFDNTERESGGNKLAKLASEILPSVVTYHKLPGGSFLVKSANNGAFVDNQAAQGAVMPAPQVAQDIGQQNAQAMQPGQTATAVADPVPQPDPTQQQASVDPNAMPPDPSQQDPSQQDPSQQDPTQQPVQPPPDPSMFAGNPRAKVVDEFGQYKVQDMLGNSLVGHVFPQTLAWDEQFTPQNVALFTNGSVYSAQDTVAGELVGKGTNLPSDSPRGDGTFYVVDGGDATCTAPVNIGSSVTGPDGLPKFQGSDLFGNPLMISFMEGLKSPARIGENEFALPSNWKFMRLNNQSQLVPDPLQMNKSAAVRDSNNSVILFYNGAYNLKGGCGLDKLASHHRFDLDPVHAEFMLGLLGVDGATAKIKVAEARKKGAVKLAGLKKITLLSERYAEAEKTASVVLRAIQLPRVDLVKFASSLDDADSADKVLALNFINHENLLSFIAAIPELEETSEKLAEMLLASYLGMKEVPEEETERAMRNMEEVLSSLKAAAQVTGSA